MKKKFVILLLMIFVLGSMASLIVFAAKPEKCSPWPSCRDGGEDPPIEPPTDPPSCPSTNTGTPKKSLVMATLDSLFVYQWDSGANDYVEVASLTDLGFSSVKSMVVGDVMSCHPGTEIVITARTPGSGHGKKAKPAKNWVNTYVFDGVDITEVDSFESGIPGFGMAIGSLYPSSVDQLLIDSTANSGPGTEIAELYEHDGTSFVKVHEFPKNPLSTANWWTFIGDLTGSGINVAGIQKGNSDALRFGFTLWESQAGSWVNVANIDAGEFVHDDGELVDFDGDGIVDLATVGGNGDLVVVKGGTYEILLNSNISNGPTQSLAVGDFNGDSCSDIAVATQGIGSDAETYTLAVFEGNCAGGFDRVSNLNSIYDDNPIQIQIMESSDLNGNGLDEIFLYQYDWDAETTVLTTWEYNSANSTYGLSGYTTVTVGEGTSTVVEAVTLP